MFYQDLKVIDIAHTLLYHLEDGSEDLIDNDDSIAYLIHMYKLLLYMIPKIPIYTMHCFKVSKKVRDKVNVDMARFWWGQKQDERKIHSAS